ncbi:hypothetical protein T4B_4394 [Trichinella pseudospiralis]|uniref:Uncharacterized protein n=1 Tax=Trichinella pseudospiralis TaxID=6337 RepID=A0A0V1GIL0_TRIPS|nr:hypothetical protein T4B_4394 [Trichinella pseudospiralis]
MNAIMNSKNVSQRYHSPLNQTNNALDPSLAEDKL